MSTAGGFDTPRRAGAPDAKDPTLRRARRIRHLALRTTRQVLREVKFPDLMNKRVWSEAPGAFSTTPPVGTRGATAVADWQWAKQARLDGFGPSR